VLFGFIYTEIGWLLTYLHAVDIWPLIKTSTPSPSAQTQ